MDAHLDYWKECIRCALDECGITLADEHVTSVAEAVRNGHENYGMAFYQPPASDRMNEIERNYKNKIDAIQREMDQYRHGAESAIKRAPSNSRIKRFNSS